MKLTDANLEAHKLPVGNFGFSATKIDDLGATEYTLATLVCDRSGTTLPFRAPMEKSLQEIVKSLSYSERADNLLLRVIAFSHKLDEVHGFKPLDKCNPDDYLGSLSGGGDTALYEATYNGVASSTSYARQLVGKDFAVNAIVVVMTDGDNNVGGVTADFVREEIKQAVQKETLESLMVILVGVNVTDPYMSKRLAAFQAEVGITQYIEMGDVTAKSFAKLAEFISKSISSQSKALGTGSASQPIQPTI